MISLLKSKSDLFNLRAIYVSADKISVYHWYRGALGSTYLFDIDDAGRENFKRYLQESPSNTPMYMLVDIIEEEFRQDTIPHVYGSDREALIERKQSRLFRDAMYLYAKNEGREQEGRRDDRLLFMALTNKDIIKPWLDLIDEFKIPLKGILSVPQLLQSLIKTIPDLSDYALVVTMQSISGLRQTFFQNKELKISRLSKLPRYGTEPYPPRIINEIDKIQRYLNSLRLIPTDKALDVYVIADKSTLDLMEKEKALSAMIRIHLLDINQLSDKTGFNTAQSTPFADHFLLFNLFKSRPENCYASSHEMRYSRMRNIRYAMNICSISILLFTFIYSGFNFMGGVLNKQQSESAKNKANFYQARYDLAKERLPKTPVETAQIKVAVDASGAIAEHKSTPYEMLSLIGRSLEQFPEIKLDDFNWRFSMDPNISKIQGEATSIPSNDINEKPVKYYQVSELNMHIEPFDGNYREAIAMVNKFTETLRSFDYVYDVSVESLPLDISSNATLQGDTDVSGKEALFSLRAVIGVN